MVAGPNLIVPALHKILQDNNVQRIQTFLARPLWSLYDKEKKRRKAWGEEVGFCSYMPPFFFDFFFLAFVGLFTRFHIHNGLCLRILRFFRNRFFPTVFSGPDHFDVLGLEVAGRIFFP
ncbi:hypothetical protein E6H33_05310 [Candidatus Bathyarchaeota archaeon]|nr:MAG: hypothetical protein E6H33_05310 [Candidatus Bathyarchaeota archaeon]